MSVATSARSLSTLLGPGSPLLTLYHIMAMHCSEDCTNTILAITALTEENLRRINLSYDDVHECEISLPGTYITVLTQDHRLL